MILNKRRCTACRTWFSRRMHLCPVCGQEWRASVGGAICQVCGARIEPGEDSCAYCDAERQTTLSGAIPRIVSLIMSVAAVGLGAFLIWWIIPLGGQQESVTVPTTVAMRPTTAAPAELGSAAPTTTPLATASYTPHPQSADSVSMFEGLLHVPDVDLNALMLSATQTAAAPTAEMPVAVGPTATPVVADAPEPTEEPEPVEAPEPTAEPEAPTATPEPQPTVGPRVHTVAQGDTLGAIAVQYGVPSAELARANNVSLTAVLRIGQELVIPASQADPESPAEQETAPPVERRHTVARGDVLTSIAVRYGVSSAAIAEANNISVNATLRIGQELVIPGTQAEPTPEPATPTPEPATATPQPTLAQPTVAQPTVARPTVAQPTATPTPLARTHTVARGDTLGSIAVRYGVTSAALAEANGISLTSILRLGQELVIPDAPPAETGDDDAPAATPTPATRTHTVARGDVLSSIAVRYGVSSAAIAEANNISVNATLRIGQELVIPGAPPAAESPTPEATPEPNEEPEVQRTPRPTETPTPTPTVVRHVVAQGDTLGGIAVRYGVSSAAIAEANGIRLTTVLRIGQELVIPGSTVEPTPEAEPTPEPTLSPTPTTAPLPTPMPVRTPVARMRYRPPTLLTPTNGAVVRGNPRAPMLHWTSVGILADNEWYLVKLWTPDSRGAPMEVLTRATSWRVPRDLYPQGLRESRFDWQVTVVQTLDVAPGRVAQSPPSQVYSFTWR